MLTTPPAVFRPRRPRQKRIAAPPAQTILVESVTTDDEPSPGACLWVFQEAVTISGAISGLQVQVTAGWIDATSAIQGGASAIYINYPTSETLDGKLWRINATPTGVVQAASIIVPQNGVVQLP